MSCPKQIILVIIVLLLTSATNAQTYTKSTAATITDSIQKNYSSFVPLSMIDSLVSFGKRFLHKPYNYRLDHQTRFDCSGFTSYVYSNFGYLLKRSSHEQAKQFDKINRDNLKTGDLVFFSGRRNNNQVGHVGIVVTVEEDGKFDFIHSSNHSGVVISKSEENYYAKRYIRAGRVINDSTKVRFQQSMANEVQEEAFNVENLSTLVNNQSPPTLTQNHLVVKGDSLYAIARKYGITVNDLKKYNHLTSDRIQPKQLLKVTNQDNPVL